MDYVIRTFGLEKRFGAQRAVRDLALNVPRGGIYGFLGRNGAGKTTTIGMLLGLIAPTAGRIELFGERMKKREHLRRIGSMGEQPGFYLNLSARENLELWRRLAGVPLSRAVDAALETVGLEGDAQKRVGRFSLGMRQRLGIARAILHSPELLVLDEPTNGLDPAGIQAVRRLLASLTRERGLTIFLSSHLLSEVQQVADTVGVIHEGALREEVAMSEIERRNRRFIELEVDDEARTAFLLERELGIGEYRIEENGRVRVFACLDRPGEVNRVLVAGGVAVSHLAVRREDLEQYFITLTGGSHA